LAPRNAGVFTCCEGSTNLGLLTDSLAVSETSSMSGYVWVQSRNAMVQGYFEPQILICVNHLRLGHPNPTNIRCKKSKNWELKGSNCGSRMDANSDACPNPDWESLGDEA
jgi:hypothetical protein